MRRLVPLLFFAVLLTACGTAGKTVPGRTPSQRYEYRTGKPGVNASAEIRENVSGSLDKPDPAVLETEADASLQLGLDMIGFAQQFLGVPYKYGGNGPDRFDCSGFTCFVYKKFGLSLARTSREQFSGGQRLGSFPQVRPGDLVFFARQDGRIFHVGIVVETMGDHFTFIHASSSAGVTISRSDEAYWQPKLYGIKSLAN